MSENKYKVIPVSKILEESDFTIDTDRKVDGKVLEDLINKVYAQYKVEGYKFHSVTGGGLLYVIFEKVEMRYSPKQLDRLRDKKCLLKNQ